MNWTLNFPNFPVSKLVPSRGAHVRLRNGFVGGKSWVPVCKSWTGFLFALAVWCLLTVWCLLMEVMLCFLIGTWFEILWCVLPSFHVSSRSSCSSVSICLPAKYTGKRQGSETNFQSFAWKCVGCALAVESPFVADSGHCSLSSLVQGTHTQWPREWRPRGPFAFYIWHRVAPSFHRLPC